MEEKNITALISCFARCYHYKNNKYRIFSDNIAEKILSSEEYNSIATRIPSSTEDAIKDNETSFVDVCFGTKTPTVEQVSQGIIGTLIRFCAYDDEKDNDNNDFIEVEVITETTIELIQPIVFLR